MELLQKFISVYLIFLCLPQVNLQNLDSNEYFISLLSQELFQGKWQSNDRSFYQFNYLNHDSGMINLKFQNGYLGFVVLDPRFYEDKYVLAQFQLNNYSESSQAWIGQTKLFLKGVEQFQEAWIESSCEGTYVIKFNSRLEKIDINQLQIDVDLQSNSQNNYHCLINMSFNVKRIYDFTFFNDLIFGLMATIILIISFLSAYNQLKKIEQEQIQFQQISLLGQLFSIFQGQNIFHYLINALFQNINYYYFFILPCLIQLVQLIFKDPRIFIAIWVKKQVNEQVEPRVFKKKFIFLLIILNIFIFTNVILLNIYEYSFYFMLTQAFILYPQIIHNLRLNIDYQFDKLYIFGYLSSKLFFYFYARSCPSNVRGMKPDYLFV